MLVGRLEPTFRLVHVATLTGPSKFYLGIILACYTFDVMNHYLVYFYQTERQTDRHTDSGDLSPTRTCVPYVLLATV